MEAELKAPLLEVEEAEDKKRSSSPRNLVRLSGFAVLQLIFFTICTAILFIIFRFRETITCGGSALFYCKLLGPALVRLSWLQVAPAREAVIPELKLIEGRLESKNIYKGTPSNATDDALNALFQCRMTPSLDICNIDWLTQIFGSPTKSLLD